MKLVTYLMSGQASQMVYENKDKILHMLINAKEKKEHNFSFYIKHCQIENELVLGVLYQQYLSQSALTRNTDGSFAMADVWDTTVFALDCTKNYLFVEKKRYLGVNLSHGRTIQRIHDYLNGIFLQLFGGTVTLVSMIMGVDTAFIQEQLKAGNVKSLVMAELFGKNIPEGTVLHNPTITWDDVWTNSYNNNDRNEIDEIAIKAKTGHTLKKSIIAKAVLSTGGKPKQASVYDESEGKYVTVKEVTEAYIDVKTDKGTEAITRVELGKDQIKKSQSRISKFELGAVPINEKPKGKRNTDANRKNKKGNQKPKK